MMALLGYLSLFLFSVSPVGAEDTDSLLIEAINHIQQNEHLPAANILGQLFYRNISNETKGKIAFLMYIPEVFTAYSKNGKMTRIQLGDFAAKHYRLLTSNERGELFRELGDYYFKIGILETAKDRFKRGLELTELSVSLSEYLRYKLGWVLSNLGEYAELFKVWDQHTITHIQGDLKFNFHRDYARFVVEAALNGADNINSLLPASIKIPELQESMQQGIAIALKFYRGKYFHRVLSSVINTVWFEYVFAEGLRLKKFSSQSPCEIIPWLNHTQGDISSDVAYNLIKSCFNFNPLTPNLLLACEKLKEDTSILFLKGHLAQLYQLSEKANGFYLKALRSWRETNTDIDFKHVWGGINQLKDHPLLRQELTLLATSLIGSPVFTKLRTSLEQSSNSLSHLRFQPISLWYPLSSGPLATTEWIAAINQGFLQDLVDWQHFLQYAERILQEKSSFYLLMAKTYASSQNLNLVLPPHFAAWVQFFNGATPPSQENPWKSYIGSLQELHNLRTQFENDLKNNKYIESQFFLPLLTKYQEVITTTPDEYTFLVKEEADLLKSHLTQVINVLSSQKLSPEMRQAKYTVAQIYRELFP